MKDSPYSRFANEQLILRDELAVDRTLLANERTLLAYLRSGMALVIAGITIVHYSTGTWFWWVGVVCVPVGAVTTIVGIVRYRAMNRAILRIRQRSDVARQNQ